MPMSTRVYGAGLTARLIGRLEIELVETVYAQSTGASRRCPVQTNTQPNCTVSSTLSPEFLHLNCSHRMTTDRSAFNGPSAADAEPLRSVAMATDDAVSELMRQSALWDKLSKPSRDFLRSMRPLRAAVTVGDSVFFSNYSAVVDELILLLPVPSRDVMLPRPLLSVDRETALFAPVSGLLALASGQRATGSQCALGHLFYTCGHLAATERVYFRSNWSLAMSEVKDVRYLYSDSTTEQLYADTIECPQHAITIMSASVVKSRGCVTTDDVRRWYSACKEMLSGTSRAMESMIGRTRKTVDESRQRCVFNIVGYLLLICIQVCLFFYFQ